MPELGVEPEELLKDYKPPAETQPKKARKAMSPADFQKLVESSCEDAVSYVEEEISGEREQATEYYNGTLPDVDKDADQEDRSRAVLTEVRDVVLGMMPDLLRIFFGSEGICKYLPVPVDDPEKFKQNEAAAKQATEYVQHVVLRTDNPDNFLTFYNTFQDALIRKTGFIRYWWEKSKRPIYTRHTGLTLEDIHILLNETGGDKVELVSKRAYANEGDTALAGQPVLYDIQLKRVCEYGKVRIAAVPCENFFVNRSASSMEVTRVFGHSEDKTVGDWVALGYDEADLADCDKGEEDGDKTETQARNGGNDTTSKDDDDKTDPSARKVKFTVAYIRADRDGDGIDELIQCICAGTKYKIIDAEPCDDVDYAAFCPYPEAHVFFGKSLADLTMDIMRIKSRVLRDVLDSLAQSVTPQSTVVEGQVNLDDVLNPDTSKVVRQRAPGMYQPLVVPFVGKEGLPILDLMTQVREARTGMSDASQGLDPKVLQSTDKAAVQATLSRAQARIEMVARIFAETGMKRLFRGILKLIVKHQNAERTVQLRGGVAKIDPRSWNADMDVLADVPLGRGSGPEQVASLMTVAAKQEQIIQTFGPDGKFCNLDHLFYTYSRILEALGWQNASSFFGDPSLMSPEEKAAMIQQMKAATQAQQPAGPAAPDPQVEMAKIASQEKIKLAEIQFKQLELQTKTQIESMKVEADMHMRALEIQAQNATTIGAEQIKAAVKHAGDRIAAETKIMVEKLKPRGGEDTGAGDGSERSGS